MSIDLNHLAAAPQPPFDPPLDPPDEAPPILCPNCNTESGQLLAKGQRQGFWWWIVKCDRCGYKWKGDDYN